MASMFERLGGTPGVTALIDIFYSKILACPVTSAKFQDRDVVRVKKYQVEFFSNALGSGTPYTGQGMVAIHTGMNVTEEQFASVAGLLSDSLKELNVAQDI